MLYVYDLAWIVNERDQPILVPAYIKHRQIAHKVGGTEGRLQRAGVLPHRSLDRVCPVLERLGRFREPRAAFPHPPLSDDPHTNNSKPPPTPCSRPRENGESTFRRAPSATSPDCSTLR